MKSAITVRSLSFSTALFWHYVSIFSAGSNAQTSTSPIGSAPSGCVTSVHGKYDLATVFGGVKDYYTSGDTFYHLNGGELIYSDGSISYFDDTHALVFMSPPLPADIPYTTDWTICPNTSLGLGSQTGFFQCEAGTNPFYIYNADIGGCQACELQLLLRPSFSSLADFTTTATTATAPVSATSTENNGTTQPGSSRSSSHLSKGASIGLGVGLGVGGLVVLIIAWLIYRLRVSRRSRAQVSSTQQPAELHGSDRKPSELFGSPIISELEGSPSLAEMAHQQEMSQNQYTNIKEQ